MYILRSLIIFGILFSETSLAAQKTVEVSTSVAKYSPKCGALTLEEKLQNNISSFDVALKGIQSFFNSTVALTYSRNTADYSRYLIYDQTATNSVSLGGNLSESNLSIDHVASFGAHIFEIIAATNFGTTPLRKSNLSLAYINKINSTNTWGVTFASQKQNVPLNYFQNPNLSQQPEARPQELDTHSLDFNFEHIFSEKFKNRFEVNFGQRIQDRPLRYGLSIKNIFVLNDSMAVRLDLGYLAENRSENLKSDLGYQNSNWIETKWIHTFNAYLNYGLGYAVEINQEYRPWSNSTEQLGNDQLLLDLNYSASTWNFIFSTAVVKYNTGQTGTNMKAGVGWNL